jgi:rRNA maturation protein Nop10
MGRLESPREYPESQEDGICPECHLKFEDITFVWYGEYGVGECPECGGEIEVDAPEPDFDRYDPRVEAYRERMGLL